MLFDLLKAHLGENTAPFAAIAIFVVVVGGALWLTPKVAGWFDRRRNETKGFFDDMIKDPPERDEADGK